MIKRSKIYWKCTVGCESYAGTRPWHLLSSAIDSINRRARELRRPGGEAFALHNSGAAFLALGDPLATEDWATIKSRRTEGR